MNTNRLLQLILAGLMLLGATIPVATSFTPWTTGEGTLRKWNLADYPGGAIPYWINPTLYILIALVGGKVLAAAAGLALIRKRRS